MIEIFSAFGLSAATGLNAYLPLLIVGLLSRFTSLITLAPPWNTLENTWVLVVLAVLLAVETTVDKIPGVDTVNDIIQTFIRPAAGAILFAAGSTIISDISPALAVTCGIIVSGGVHTVKGLARPLITAGTGGLGNPLVSTIEDIASGVTTVLSVVFPPAAVLLIILLLVLFIRRSRRRKRMNAERNVI
ncbi:MAG TPA: DUF4126 domain-containing protein [Acidobacteriota bacterium]|nr:DUF4126 domain-containing protein [Acidobacteriota bacterium]